MFDYINLFLTEASGSGSGDAAAAGVPWTSYIMIGVLALILIGFFIFSTISNRKRRKEAEEQISALKPGDKVKTIGGVCGFVVSINDEENTIVISTGTDKVKSYVKFDKGAIYQTGEATPKETRREERAQVTSAPIDEPVVEETEAQEPETESHETLIDGKPVKD